MADLSDARCQEEEEEEQGGGEVRTGFWTFLSLSLPEGIRQH